MSLWWLGVPVVWLCLVAIYRRARRERVVIVSSTLFFDGLTDARARTTQRRLTDAPELLRIGAIATGLVVALANPSCDGGAGPRSVVLAIDVTASMAAADDGGTRFALAVSRARAVLADVDAAALVACGRVPRIVVPMTAETDDVAAAIGALRVEAVAGRLAPCVEMAQGLAGAELHVFSDAEVPVGSNPTESVVVHRFATRRDNIGLTAVAVSETATSRRVQIEIFNCGAGAVDVAVVAGDQRVPLRIAPSRATQTVLPLAPGTEAVEIYLAAPDGDPWRDALALDDRVRLSAINAEPSRLVFAAPDSGLAAAIGRWPRATVGESVASPRDVGVTERGAVARAARRPQLAVRPQTIDGAPCQPPVEAAAGVLTWSMEHPAIADVYPPALEWLDVRPLPETPWLEPLIRLDGAPVLSVAAGIAVAGFDLGAAARHPAGLVLVARLLDWLAPPARPEPVGLLSVRESDLRGQRSAPAPSRSTSAMPAHTAPLGTDGPWRVAVMLALLALIGETTWWWWRRVRRAV